MSAPSIDVRVVGVQKILRKLNKTDPVIAKPWTSALHEAAEVVHAGMEKDAPGALGLAVRTKLQARPVPTWAHVGLMPMPMRKGFRYPGALHGARSRYHYRSGPMQGQSTHGWLTKALFKLQGSVNSILSKAAGEIEREWSK